jgi:hypothetical protein
MSRFSHRQRGEGKVGCVVTFVVLAVVAAAAIKAVPVFWTDSELQDAAKDLATRAGAMKVETIELQVKTKARELEIPEALAPGAIIATKVGDTQQGKCTVSFRYTRTIDFYGAFKYDKTVNTQVTAQYFGGA